MLHAHDVAAVRAAEDDLLARLPEGALMDRAATGLAHAVVDFLGGAYGRRVLLLVGSGDNGGDALYAGARLARRGALVEAWLFSERAHAGGLSALRAAGGRVRDRAPATLRDDWHVVIDGIVGIGGRGGLREDAASAVEAVAGIPVVAVDTPSGVDVDTGEVSGPHVVADLTVTFGTHKPCHLADPAAWACGAVQLVDLGLDLPAPDVEALQPSDVAALVPRPAPDAHKYTRGVVGVRAGSDLYPGAALLSVAGAATGLAGMVRYVGPEVVADRVRGAHPEVVGNGRVQAWVVGSGSAGTAGTALEEACEDGVPLVVDADALEHAHRVRGTAAVLTPHAGELARLLEESREAIEARPLHHARRAARELDAVVLLKGRRTVTAAPDGATRVTLAGTPWLGTAGAGDVLGGLIGALLAGGLAPYDAASVGSWLHGAAATAASGGGPLVASDVARAVPAVLRALP
ncbi:NAD(P)H-hydrate dehydratase [Nocardioides panacisoli]|uniref:NAD(P)H-hydrate dehydratase n=1 Tax=Nocardioides panacisoli TaxID=627624 RepID=UPI001C62EEA7|nr:NAD(P)H-hydrate dehydratase [Nocardioides panacisoli]QYJ02587.1 NAD(P)H-hydrate dehydratase [Nocardioides panacisoli]